MANRKNKDRSRRRRDAHRANKAKKRNRAPGSKAKRDIEISPTDSRPLEPPGLSRCHPPIDVELGPRRVPDPYVELDLDPDAAHTPEDIRTAWRRAIERHPPEREAEKARALTAARDRLIAPEKVFERKLGRLHAPDPEAFGLPVERPPAPEEGKLGSRARLLGQLALYAILEEELAEEGPTRKERQQELPF